MNEHTEKIQSLDLTQSMSEASNFQEALAIALGKVGEVSDWDYGEAWIPSQEGTVLELSPAWYRNTNRNSAWLLAVEQFRHCSEGFIFPPAIGLPGRVWLSQQPEWLYDASAESETYFLRNQIARAFGIRAGFGVPVVVNHQVLAVLIFFMSQAQGEDQQRARIAQAAATQLGLGLASATAQSGTK